MDWRFNNKISVLSNIYGLIYFFMAKELIDRFGEEGEICLKNALKKYGYFRGNMLRAEHENKGFDINVKSFCEHYDLPKDDRSVAKCFERSEYTSYSEYYTCQFSDMWKLLEEVPGDGITKIGKIYCESFHEAMWNGYCPEMKLKLDKMITCGDQMCTFQTKMPKDYISQKPFDFPTYNAMDWRYDDPISALQNIYGFLYFYICKETCDTFKDKGEAAMRSALIKYGHFRGGLLAKEHVRRGLEINVKNFFENYDLPKDERTTRNRTLLTETEAYSENYSCQFSDIWKILEGIPIDGDSLIGRIYCESFHQAMWEGYCPTMKVELPKILTVGDDRCIFRTTKY